LTTAIKCEVDLMVIAGDLFDRPRPDTSVVGQVQAGLQRLVERGITPVLLPGTHDSVVPGDSVYRRSEFPGAIVLDRPTVEEPARITIRGEEVFLYGFAYRSFLSEQGLDSMVRRPEDGIHIGLLHGSQQGSPEWDYRKKDLPFTLAELKSWGLDYVALGHYHQFGILQEGGRIYACYPGAPEGKRFGENGPRYCAMVNVSSGSASVEREVVNRQVLEEQTLDLGGCESEEAAVAAISALGRPELLLRLSLAGIVEAPLDLVALHARCADRFFHLELLDKTRLFDSDFAGRIAQEETVRGVFVRQVRRLLADTPEERRAVVEEAFREVLVRFRAFGGGDA
jgi:DNA repair exonuclease SbcCD nuclease subunit